MGEVRTVMFQAVTDVAMQRGAVLSLDGVYRYHLWRRLGPGDRSLGFVMLNPSTADANEDDPTIRKCVGFARTLGYDMVEVCNLFALRSTDPKGLRGHPDPIGPDRDHYIRGLNLSCREVICAWGANARRYPDRVLEVVEMISAPLHALRLLEDGVPEHPLMLPYSCKPQRWSPTNG